jgi:hypothetical protein
VLAGVRVLNRRIIISNNVRVLNRRIIISNNHPSLVDGRRGRVEGQESYRVGI